MPYWEIGRSVYGARGRGRGNWSANETNFVISGETIEFQLIPGGSLLEGQFRHSQQWNNWLNPFNLNIYQGAQNAQSLLARIAATPSHPNIVRYRFNQMGSKHLVFRGSARYAQTPTATAQSLRRDRPEPEQLFPAVDITINMEVVTPNEFISRVPERSLAEQSRGQVLVTAQGTASHTFQQWEVSQADRERQRQETEQELMAGLRRQRGGASRGILVFDHLPDTAIPNLTMEEYEIYVEALNNAVRATPLLDLRNSTMRWYSAVRDQIRYPTLRWVVQSDPYNPGLIRIFQEPEGLSLETPAESREFQQLRRDKFRQSVQRVRQDDWLVFQLDGDNGPIGPVLMRAEDLRIHIIIRNFISLISRVCDAIDFYTLAVGIPALAAALSATAVSRSIRAVLRRAINHAFSRLGRRTLREVSTHSDDVARATIRASGEADDAARAIGTLRRAIDDVARGTAARINRVPDEVFHRILPGSEEYNRLREGLTSFERDALTYLNTHLPDEELIGIGDGHVRQLLHISPSGLQNETLCPDFLSRNGMGGGYILREVKGSTGASGADIGHGYRQLANAVNFLRRMVPDAQIDRLEIIIPRHGELPNAFEVIGTQLMYSEVGRGPLSIEGIPVHLLRLPYLNL